MVVDMHGLALGLFLISACLAPAQERLRDVIYLRQGGAAFTFDVFKPKTSNRKAIVWLVSGLWFSAHEMINPDLAKPMTDAGFTVFEVVHGSQPRYQVPEIVGELQRAIRFIHANAKSYGIDPNAIGVCGMSTGGHLALMLGGLGDDGRADAKDPVDRSSDRVAAVVAIAPPTDFLNWGADGATPWKLPGNEIFMPAFGATASTPDEKLRQIGHDLSPINTVNPRFPPTLLVHGDKDPFMPLQQSRRMDAALEAAKIVHKLLIVPGGGHDAKTLLGGFQQMMEWFNVHLVTRAALEGEAKRPYQYAEVECGDRRHWSPWQPCQTAPSDNTSNLCCKRAAPVVVTVAKRPSRFEIPTPPKRYPHEEP